MVSEAFTRIENALCNNFTVYDELISAICYKLKDDRASIDRAIHLACITSSSSPFEMAMSVNEFLVHLDEKDRNES